MIDSVLNYASNNFDSFVTDLSDCLQFPSISTLPHHGSDVIDCAEFVSNHLTHIGLQHVTLINDYGAPIIYADYIVNDSLPTLLIYGHYDVQPADPVELWDSPPFEPTISNGYIVARGASDNKGMFYAYLKAIQSYLTTTGSLPINIKVCIEGEEEIGSNGLMQYLSDNPSLFFL
tara:strand:+ start:127 stop:651 length:525 start_codon:yes stop_codon:yes gene_type:complete